MTTAEETRPLLHGPQAAGESRSTTAAENDRRGTTLKGIVITALTALAVYLMAATASRTIFWEDSSLSVEETMVDGGEGGGSSLDSTLAATADSHLLSSGLVNPNNGTHPTLTRTEECTGGTSTRMVQQYSSNTPYIRMICITLLCTTGLLGSYARTYC